MLPLKKTDIKVRILLYVILYFLGYGLFHLVIANGYLNYVLLEVLKYKVKDYVHYFHMYNKFVCLIVVTFEYLLLITKEIQSQDFGKKFISFLIVTYFITSYIAPAMRILDFHGLWHLAITATMADSLIGVAPDCPYLASVKLQYPWGYYYLPIFISKFTSLSYSWCNVLLNSFELFVTYLCISKISKIIYNNVLCRNLSILLALSGSYIVIHYLSRYINSHFHIVFENRISPPVHKFYLNNAMPIGVCFFMMYFYSLFKINELDIKIKYYITIFAGVLGSTFFYPPLIFSVLCCCGVSFILWCFQWSKYRFHSIFTAFAVIIAFWLVKPYLNSIASGYSVWSIISHNPAALMMKVICLLATFFFTIVIYIIARCFGWKPDGNSKKNYLILNIISLIISYLFINLACNNEYKSLWVAAVLLGLIVAQWLYIISLKNYRLFIVILLLLSLTTTSFTEARLFYGKDNNIGIVEKGTAVIPDSDYADVYEWVKNNTPADSYWLCDDIKFPICTGRKLYVWDGKWHQRGFSMDILREVCLYQESVISQHKANAEVILNAIDSGQECSLVFGKTLYVITVNKEITSSSFQKLYVSENNKYMVLAYVKS